MKTITELEKKFKNNGMKSRLYIAFVKLVQEEDWKKRMEITQALMDDLEHYELIRKEGI